MANTIPSNLQGLYGAQAQYGAGGAAGQPVLTWTPVQTTGGVTQQPVWILPNTTGIGQASGVYYGGGILSPTPFTIEAPHQPLLPDPLFSEEEIERAQRTIEELSA